MIRILKAIAHGGGVVAVVALIAIVPLRSLAQQQNESMPGEYNGIPERPASSPDNVAPTQSGASATTAPSAQQATGPASNAPPSTAAASATPPANTSGRSTDDRKVCVKGKEEESACVEKKCAGAFEDARTACGDTLGLGNMLNSAAGTASSGPGSIEKQCERASKLQQLSALLNGAKAAACGYMIYDCLNTCPTEEDEKKFTPNTVANHHRCSNYKIYVAQMVAQAGAGMMAAMQSGQCKKLSSNFLPPAPLAPITPPIIAVPSIPPYAAVNCSTSPNDPTCQTCLQNPTAAGCSAKGPATAGLGGTTNPGAAGAGYKSTINEDAPQDPNVKITPAGPRGSDQAGNGGGGGGLGGGSGSQKLNGDDSGRAPSGAGVNTSVLGGPLPGGGGYNYGKGAAGSGSDSRNPFAGAWDKLKNKFSLKGMIPTNTKAGALDGKATDVSGAGGPTIWEKINIQYTTQTVAPLP